MQRTVEPEKLYYEKQKDDRDVYWRNEEAVSRKRRNLNESEEEQLGQLFTVSTEEQKQNSALAIEEEMENP